MALEAYRGKRDFAKTPEPAGKRQKTDTRRLFVVQKHAATQLHYDFRLELEGVLLSWAVPKGPSLDPAEKRLAVQVEDHPVAYGDFEGIIPEGEYGGGTVLLWDRGEWTPLSDPHDAIKKGTLKFTVAGKKLWGGYTLVRIKKEGEQTRNWLLIKERDDAARPEEAYRITDEEPFSVVSNRSIPEIAEAKDWVWTGKGRAQKAKPVQLDWRRGLHRGLAFGVDKIPDAKKVKFFKPVLPSPKEVVEVPNGKEWLHEVLHAGHLALGVVSDRAVTLLAQDGTDWTSDAPEIVRALGRLPVESAIVVGTLVAPGATDSTVVEETLKRKDASGLQFMLFDLPYLTGFDLRKVSLIARKELLSSLLQQQSTPLQYADHVQGKGSTVSKEARRLDALGMVSRRADSLYPGKATADWVVCRFKQEPSSKPRAVAAKSVPEELVIEGVTITHPNRVLYPEERVTKGMVAEYYRSIAPLMLPFVANRPLSLYRCPQGIERECFFQKHVSEMPHVHEAKGKEPYVVIKDVKGLLTLVQWNVLEIHTWGCTTKNLDKPDQMIFDLDPGPGAPWELVVEGAKGVRWLLEQQDMACFVKTSGGKGLHVVAPLAPKKSWDEIKEFAGDIARQVAKAAPKHFTALMSKTQRKGKVFIDYFRNQRGSTTVAAYSTRARPGARISWPLGWDEVGALRPVYDISQTSSAID